MFRSPSNTCNCFVSCNPHFVLHCQDLQSRCARTANGRVSVLAYVEGEEDFVDVSGDNIHNTNEPFNDLGRAFRDDNGNAVLGANGVYDTGEFRFR